MTRRERFPFNGKRFIGNKNNNEVHDLDKERTTCQIDDIKREHVRTFSPDTHSQAKSEGFDNCAKCIGNSNY